MNVMTAVTQSFCRLMLVLYVALSTMQVFAQANVQSADQSITQSAEYWLEKMQDAAAKVNYRGTFVFSRGEMTSSMQIVHRYTDGLEQERMKQLDGEMGEIIRNGSEVICILPGNRIVQVEPDQFSNKVVQAFSGFMPDHKYYSLQLVGFDRLVERSTVKLAISANDQNRYSYSLWLDQQTGLLLKSSLLDHSGVELERFHYTQIDFPLDISPDELKPSSHGGAVTHEMIPPVKKDFMWPGAMDWDVSWVPPGYEQVKRGAKASNNVMLYSDGLATYSVFVEKVASDMMPNGASMVGAMVAYSLKLSSDEHHYNVTVVGEIPAMTAMMVAESVKPSMPDDINK